MEKLEGSREIVRGGKKKSAKSCDLVYCREMLDLARALLVMDLKWGCADAGLSMVRVLIRFSCTYLLA